MTLGCVMLFASGCAPMMIDRGCGWTFEMKPSDHDVDVISMPFARQVLRDEILGVADDQHAASSFAMVQWPQE